MIEILRNFKVGRLLESNIKNNEKVGRKELTDVASNALNIY